MDLGLFRCVQSIPIFTMKMFNSMLIVAMIALLVVVGAADQQLRVADVSSRQLQSGQTSSGSYFQLLQFSDSTCTTLTFGQINVINSCVAVTPTTSGIYSYSGTTLTANYYNGLNCVGTVANSKSYTNVGSGACFQST